MQVIPRRVIWELLETGWQLRLSEPVVRRHSPGTDVQLLECAACGLQYFLPPQEGDAEYYRELGSFPHYYSHWKWEFGWVLDRLSPAMTVLDAGCGQGDFLAAAGPRVLRVVGLESNPAAAAAGAARGLQIFSGAAAEFAGHHAGAFDAACAFHVVEHLSAPVSFLRQLLSCLRPSGSLFISVPNRGRSAMAAVEPLDCPPHHLTRWAPAQLRKLGDVLGIRLLEIGFEPVAISIPRERIRALVRERLGRIPLAGEFLGLWASRAAWRLVLPEVAYKAGVRTGGLERLGFYGLSMVARYVRPGN